MARCGLCRKEVRWGFTTQGETIAVDWRPHPEGTVYRFPIKHALAGRLRVLTDEEVERAKRAGYPLYRKHSGNCAGMHGRRPDDQMEMTL